MFKKYGMNLPSALLISAIGLYILYFSLFTITRNQKFYSHYFDLGIMHQTVYNTYKGIQTGDASRVLEMTNPHEGNNQVKRMAVHNDILLASLAPFYFIHDGPETLLVIQTIVLALGAYFIYKIAVLVFDDNKYRYWIALAFAASYLLYPPMQKANNFDFHAVTLSTTFILAMFYFYLAKRYLLSFLSSVLVLVSKEQTGLVVAFFGLFVLYRHLPRSAILDIVRHPIKTGLRVFARDEKNEVLQYGSTLVVVGFGWVFLSMAVIIPYFRGGEHFGSEYYAYIFETPLNVFPVIFRFETLHYLFILMAPVGFLSFLSPIHLLIALPEFAVNILSSNGTMRNIYFHYDSLLTPIIFVASMYGGLVAVSKLQKKLKKWNIQSELFLISYLLIFSVLFSLYLSPLPWGHHRDMFPWQAAGTKYHDVMLWRDYLEADNIKVSTTGHLAAHFTSRRYFYNFAGGYDQADYIVIDKWEITEGFQREDKEHQYALLQNDWQYIKIYDKNGIEVFRKF